MDCISLSREASARLFRQGRYPVLRGTFWSLDDNEHFLSTRGSVDFYQTYPGLYVRDQWCSVALSLSRRHGSSPKSFWHSLK